MNKNTESLRATFLAAFVAATPIGRKGWRDRALLQAEKAWRETEVARERRFEAEAEAEAEERRATSGWRVEKIWGAGAFAASLYGARARFGGGNLTWAEAQAQAEAIATSARCRQAAKEWDDYMSR